MTEQSLTATGSQTPVKKGALIAWAFYDWANNGFATVILTFIVSAYFTLRVAPDEVTGSVMWGHMASAAGLCVALGVLIGGGVVILMVHATLLFWLAGTFLGLFIGPVQAASRSYMARITPEAPRNEMFGLYAFSGKATAFVGPLLVGWLTMLSGSQRIGMSMVMVLLLTGEILMLNVPII